MCVWRLGSKNSASFDRSLDHLSEGGGGKRGPQGTGKEEEDDDDRKREK